HGTYDEFWQARNVRQHMKNIRPAVLTVGGWFDAENLFGAVQTYYHIEKLSPKQTFNTLVMGPWLHGGWNRGDGSSLGHVLFNAKTSEYFREKTELPFFNFHLKEKGQFKTVKAWTFETGTNQWRQQEAWPPRAAQKKALYFRAGGKLSFDPASGGKP